MRRVSLTKLHPLWQADFFFSIDAEGNKQNVQKSKFYIRCFYSMQWTCQSTAFSIAVYFDSVARGSLTSTYTNHATWQTWLGRNTISCVSKIRRLAPRILLSLPKFVLVTHSTPLTRTITGHQLALVNHNTLIAHRNKAFPRVDVLIFGFFTKKILSILKQHSPCLDNLRRQYQRWGSSSAPSCIRWLPLPILDWWSLASR